GNTAVAEDITSQVFLSVYQALPRYRHQERFAPWLFTIARNKIRDHYRRENHDISVDKDLPDPHGVDLLELASQTEQIDKLRTLVNALPEQQKELVLLRYVADLSFLDMAAVLKKREANVKKALYRVQEKLKDLMEDTHGPQ
ncbi:MAG: sigma-70 family RNA polymerase sigma factor, partial [Chloroflexi bacterium]|nr:sigma-70 family RNA polymerase sigma factor [Chloroflexota bacterium]